MHETLVSLIEIALAMCCILAEAGSVEQVV